MSWGYVADILCKDELLMQPGKIWLIVARGYRSRKNGTVILRGFFLGGGGDSAEGLDGGGGGVPKSVFNYINGAYSWFGKLHITLIQ